MGLPKHPVSPKRVLQVFLTYSKFYISLRLVEVDLNNYLEFCISLRLVDLNNYLKYA